MNSQKKTDYSRQCDLSNMPNIFIVEGLGILVINHFQQIKENNLYCRYLE